ncbi:hypothetical protein LTR08_002482 [Meristemomyces frigidus]|nr:hypothetical protein LTR08_002482 [Meristemomyces frigidus]
MSDLYDLLSPYLSTSPPPVNDPQTSTYLTRLSTLSLSALTTTEPASLLHAAQSHLRSLQALSKRSHQAVIASSVHLANLSTLLPTLGSQAEELRDELPGLEEAATTFAEKYDRHTAEENVVLDRRKRALLLSRNMDRVSDVLELPSLLSSTVAAAQQQATSSATHTSSATSYASSLDLHAHIKRLHMHYPHSSLVDSISDQAETEIQNLTSILITALQSPNLKLAAGMRTVGWLRRVAPDLAGGNQHYQTSSKSSTSSTKPLSLQISTTAGSAAPDGPLASLFLICRLHTLHKTLEALAPLRELADQEASARRKHNSNGSMKSKQQQSVPGSAGASSGSQSERYLKRYIEIFREQSFSIISMYKSIFATGLPVFNPSTTTTAADDGVDSGDPLLPLPSPLASFTMKLVEMLTTVLSTYMPNITDKQARESLGGQVLFCAGSLGRLGGDFGCMIALLGAENVGNDNEDGLGDGEDEVEEDEPEWVQIMLKHRIQASRLEVLARGVGGGSGRKGSEALSPGVLSPGAMSPGSLAPG